MTERVQTMSHQGPGPTADVFDWDEARDPTRAPQKPAKTPPWAALGLRDRQLLDALSDGEWTPERALRGVLGWTRFRFFITTLRLVVKGWITARPANSFLMSEYRLGSEVWK